MKEGTNLKQNSVLVKRYCQLYNLRRADQKGGIKDVCPMMHGPYFIDKVLPNGVYQVKTMDGKMLKQKQNGCNLKKFHDRQENEVKKKDTDETEIQIGMQMGRKVDGKKMNQKQKKFLEGQENETNKRNDNEAETQASKQLIEHEMTVVSRGFQMNRKVNAYKVTIKLSA